MAQYILLLHERPASPDGVSPEEIQRVIEEYRAWSESMGKAGKLIGGHKLTDEGGRLLTGWGPDFSTTDGPWAEAKEVIGGLFHISAESYDEAARLSASCPHLKYGGRIELRRVDLVD
ncbi:MAG TPA: YciI family protein [Thermoanaerobaculia bacterium]|nr:YciI family protein [Thermoanaerobaculia bacterium]